MDVQRNVPVIALRQPYVDCSNALGDLLPKLKLHGFVASSKRPSEVHQFYILTDVEKIIDFGTIYEVNYEKFG